MDIRISFISDEKHVALDVSNTDEVLKAALESEAATIAIGSLVALGEGLLASKNDGEKVDLTPETVVEIFSPKAEPEEKPAPAQPVVISQRHVDFLKSRGYDNTVETAQEWFDNMLERSRDEAVGFLADFNEWDQANPKWTPPEPEQKPAA